jgi:hypothetical protein
MKSISFDSTLRASDYLTVAALHMITHPISLTVMAAGPVLWGVGAVAHSRIVVAFGSTMSWLVIAVPVAVALIGTFIAFRPSAREIYDPALWVFSEDSVAVHQHLRDESARWHDFTRWSRLGGSHLLYTAPQHYVIIPSRDVPAERRDEFEQLLMERLGKRS